MMTAALLGIASTATAQMRVRPVGDEEGHTGLGLLLRKLDTVGSFMMATAHPDDENNALLALLGHGQGVRTALVSATRGDGGQNEIGAELFDALAVLRTEELLAAHRFDGAEQYFTRAVDFGYSFSAAETFERWVREEILADFVRMIRTLRPDVIAGMRPTGQGGGQHHQASAILAREAFRAAADPARFPEQLAAGLRPWQAKKFYFSAGFGPGGGSGDVDLEAIDLTGFDPLLGRTYAEIGSEARSMHKCQSMPQLLRLPGDAQARYRLAETAIERRDGGDDAPLFDGIDTSLPGLIQYAEPTAPRDLILALTSLDRLVRRAQQRFAQGGAQAARAPLISGLTAVRNLRGRLGTLGLNDGAVYEIDVRLEIKERQYERAVILAHGLRLEVLASDGVVAPGQPVRVTALVANRGTADIAVGRVSFDGFDGAALGCGADLVPAGGVYRCDSNLAIPAGARATTPYFARLPDAARYAFDPDAPFGLPFEPTRFEASFTVEFAHERVTVTRPALHRYEREIFSGEKRMELHVVPRLAVELSPAILVAPASGGTASRREVRVVVSNRAPEPAEALVRLTAPDGWRVEPASASVALAREDAQRTLRFFVTPPAGTALGDYEVRAEVTSDGETFDGGYQVVEYPHTRRRHLSTTAVARIKVLDIRVAPGLLVGYVMGAGDQMPAAIEQLGGRVERLDGDMLAFGDLSRYQVIVTGVRAYELDPDLRAHNDRLIRYVQEGGTLVVQYNKLGFNEAQYGPYPAQVSRNRITDEAAPVELLVPAHPLFNDPNSIDGTVWDGWVQERGLYFLGERAPEYLDLIELRDPFENNPGAKRGALVEARYGKGRWLYVALGLWRQLPAGTEGAYRLLANLISVAGAP